MLRPHFKKEKPKAFGGRWGKRGRRSKWEGNEDGAEMVCRKWGVPGGRTCFPGDSRGRGSWSVPSQREGRGGEGRAAFSLRAW